MGCAFAAGIAFVRFDAELHPKPPAPLTCMHSTGTSDSKSDSARQLLTPGKESG
jgi:hypothetical protein